MTGRTTGASTTTRPATPHRASEQQVIDPVLGALAHPHRRRAARTAVGGFFLAMAGVHLGLVAADPQVYATFADRSEVAFVRDSWRDVVMAAPVWWISLLLVGEALVGVLLLVGGRAARVGWAAAIAFHLLLLPFGWWAWVWAVPALGWLVLIAALELRAPRTRAA
ncbi:hypothetical protein [Nocardioides rubriscoriae]|uniref:hypothetical protein n=1 Tax=Nocardioides rubriscoriae TaxID=642762 RepID=UPI001B883BA3|nr:hypothetical protein [Nocardioides rubriscoriae]